MLQFYENNLVFEKPFHSEVAKTKGLFKLVE